MAEKFDRGQKRDYTEAVSLRKDTKMRRFWRRVGDFLDKNLSTLFGIAVASAAVTLLCGIMAFAMMIMPDRTGVQKVIVPDLVGTAYQAGRLDENIFRVIIEYEHDDSIAVGVVKKQYPPAGAERKVVREEHLCTLTLTVSRGKNTVMLPALAGATAEEAERRLHSLGLEARLEYVPDDMRPEGTVIATDPKAYADVPVGTEVMVKVSGKAAENVTVPALVGLDESEARRRLEALGIAVGVSEYISSDKPAGTVIEQSVPFGAEMPKNATVYLTVSTG